MHADEVLGLGVNAGLFPQLAFCCLQRFIGFKVSGRLVPQRFAVNALFDNKEFTLGVDHAGNRDMRFKHSDSLRVTSRHSPFASVSRV
jgi:hypothetical protein